MVERNLAPAWGRAVRPFVKGPIDWAWVRAAMALRGSAVHVAILIMFMSGLRKSRTVKVRLALLPIGRGSADRALRSLERAGLVRVRRQRGRWPTVTIQDASPHSAIPRT